jgi:hypothetical protein
MCCWSCTSVGTETTRPGSWSASFAPVASTRPITVMWTAARWWWTAPACWWPSGTGSRPGAWRDRRRGELRQAARSVGQGHLAGRRQPGLNVSCDQAAGHSTISKLVLAGNPCGDSTGLYFHLSKSGVMSVNISAARRSSGLIALLGIKSTCKIFPCR